MSSSILQRLQLWYSANCNGDWEHSWGVKIDTLDNPGWSVEIDLNETELENVHFEIVKIDYNDQSSWILCKVEGNQFQGNCGINQLEKVLEIFLDWVEKHKNLKG